MKYDRQTHRITIEYTGDVDDLVSSIDLQINDYNYYVSNHKDVIRDTLETLHSSVVTTYPDAQFFELRGIRVTHFNLPEKTWIGLGTMGNLFKEEVLPVRVILEVDNMDEHIEQFLSALKPLKLPDYEECMTSIKNIYKVITAILKRKVKVDEISVGLQLLPTPMTFTTFLTIKSFPENETAETLLPKISGLLKPYNTRVSINYGPLS